MRWASATCWPRIMSTDPAHLARRRAVVLAGCASFGHPIDSSARPVACDRNVRVGRELAELVPDHRLRDEHRHVLAAVVHRDRVPEHVRDDRRAARPGAHHLLLALLVHVVDLLHQVVVDERTLLQRPRHQPRPFPRRRTMYLLDAFFFLRVRPSFLPHGERRMPAAGGLALAAARAGGRPGSSRRRAPTDACPASGRGPPCRAGSARARRCRPTRRWPCRSPATSRVSPEGSRSVAIVPSLAISWTLAPAERAILAPAPGFSSIACTTVPTGMLRSGSALPGADLGVGPRHQAVALLRRPRAR